ncbi:MAG TPA: hemerythrin domain-containing protein [Polyangiaceae bacterium]|nr:hemerythrin domain-containing protein [Polyangiaceae bacterium]
MPNTLEQLGVKAVGTVKAVKAGFNGLRGVFLHLAEEHGEVIAMMKHLSKSKDAQVRREHYAKLRVELLAHERAELAELYPALAHLESTRALVALHDREATQLESAIREPFGIDALDPSSDAWGLAFDRLLVLVEQHVALEEGEIFPKAQAVLGEAAAEALRTRYEAANISAKKQLA